MGKTSEQGFQRPFILELIRLPFFNNQVGYSPFQSAILASILRLQL